MAGLLNNWSTGLNRGIRGQNLGTMAPIRGLESPYVTENKCPCEDSNLGSGIRNPLLYPPELQRESIVHWNEVNQTTLPGHPESGALEVNVPSAERSSRKNWRVGTTPFMTHMTPK